MSEDLHDLISAWLSADLSDERRAALLARLRDDADFRAAFVAEARMFAMLHAVQSPEPRWLAVQDELGLSDKSDAAFLNKISATIRSLPRPFVAAWWRPAAACAACAALGFAVLFFIKPHGSTPSVNTAENPAVVVRSDGVVWAHDTPQQPGVNEAVSTGALRLSGGRLTLACLNGVTLHIEGPADLTFVSAEHLVCRRGNVRALVSEGAQGFTIETPGAAIVDLGTEFGVKVDETGRSQVVVYQGQAEASLLAPDGSARHTQTLSAHQSVELDPQQNSIRNVPPRELLPAPDLQIPPLRLAADYAQHILSEKPLHYWRGPINNSIIEDATNNRENLAVSGSVHSSADGSIAFDVADAKQFLRMTGSWKPAGDFAIELWFASEAFHSSVLAVLQANTEPHGELSMLELTGRGRSAPSSLGRVRFLYRWPPGGSHGVNLYSGSLYQPYRWNHLVCQRHGAQIEMYLNGTSAGVTPLVGSESTTTCTLRIGRLSENLLTPNARQFQGRLAEMAVYDRALSAEQIRAHAAK